jgi:hypothetical protein
VRRLSAYTHQYWARHHDTERDPIIAKNLDLLQNILPKINNRKPPRVKLSSVEEDTLPSYEQGVLIPGHLESCQKSMVMSGVAGSSPGLEPDACQV